VPSTCPLSAPAAVLGIADQPIQGGGDGALAVGHDVLVAQGHRRRAVAHALHQLLGRRANSRGQSRGRVPQVMETQPVQAELLHGRAPHQPAEVAALQTVIVWRGQAERVAESLSKGSRLVVIGRLQQRSWTAEDGSARSTVEVLADELGPSLRWATATRTTRRQDR
jgi:Single-strand binding protein family